MGRGPLFSDVPGRDRVIRTRCRGTHRGQCQGDTMITSAFHRRSPVRGFAVLAAAACSVVLASACSGNSPSDHAAATRSPAPAATSGATAIPAPVATTQPGTPGTPAPPGTGIARCHTRQLAAAFTGLNAASGGQRGMTLILTNRSSRTCYVYGYEGLGFLGSGLNPLPTHLARISVPHTRVRLRPGGNAQAMVTWRVYPDAPGPLEYPQRVEITPPDEYTHLIGPWPAEPVRGGDITTWPLSAAPPGPVPTGAGTIQDPFNGMCVAVAGNGSANGTEVVAWKCDGDSSQRWTAYSDGTLRINGKCLDVTGMRRQPKPAVANQPGVAKPIRAHRRHRIRQCPDRPGRHHHKRHPAADGRQPRGPERTVARLVLPLPEPLRRAEPPVTAASDDRGAWFPRIAAAHWCSGKDPFGARIAIPCWRAARHSA